ncbi:SPW repeat-containing protein [Prauserella shujinwangii]|uniref:SPW repeat-containing protein n=1 Tax=Prauserella shujinwangii TaxID=1453103 RepID=A0A2T0LMV1_9PSEU|nr:SPW repeat protein [Prauserella shujinwangii]PRX44520.1 SPW repeat-containing protein [Prauserella shujinwangii]
MTPGLPSSLLFLCSVWLVFAPFALHYGFPTLSAAVDTNDVTVAVVAGMLAFARMVAPRDLPWLSLVNAALGAWLMVATFVLDYSAARHPGLAMANDLVVGAALLVLGTISATATYRQRSAERHRTAVASRP